MAGIVSSGAYVPFLRMAFAEAARAHNLPGPKGERAVAAQDEDSLTMAVEAAVDCLGSSDRTAVDGLYFASTTSPYWEKQVASTIVVACDLGKQLTTMDMGGSLRAGSSALKAALDAVAAGSNQRVLVTCADCRTGHPGSDFERTLGDAAAAFMIGNDEGGAALIGSFSVAEEITDYWRRDQDRFVHSWEERFALTQGFMRIMPGAVQAALDKCSLSTGDIAKFVFSAPSERAYWQLASKLKLDLEKQVQLPMYSNVGNCGAAMGPLGLAACLEQAQPGDKVVLATYGNGADVLVFEIGDKIAEARGAKGMDAWLSSKKELANYNQYLLSRGLLETTPDRMPPIRPPATTIWRDQNSILRFHGMKCNQCGHVQIPIHRICSACMAKDDYSEVRFSDRTGEVFTSTVDNLGYGAGLQPFWAILDFAEVRTRMQVADAVLEEVKIGDSLEMTFRKLPSENDVMVYGWKARVPR